MILGEALQWDGKVFAPLLMLLPKMPDTLSETAASFQV